MAHNDLTQSLASAQVHRGLETSPRDDIILLLNLCYVCYSTIAGERSQGRPYDDATDAAALAPRHGVWVDYSFLSDTPCAREFSRNAIEISLLTKNALVRTRKFPLER